MPGVSYTDNIKTNPVWAADYGSRDALVPAPLLLVAADFNSADATTVIPSDAAAIGDTSITVGALSRAIPAGAALYFGNYAPVTVTINDGSISAGDTSITVTALSGPIPAGETLDFSGGTNAQVVKLSAAAAQGATSITVYPADGTIANASTATFAGGPKIARLSAAAAKGATSVTVNPLDFALATTDSAYYTSDLTHKRVAAATLVGRTQAERLAGTNYSPAEAGDDDVVLVMFDVPDVNEDNSFTAYRPGCYVKENKLPGWANYTSAQKTLLRAAYKCITGAE